MSKTRLCHMRPGHVSENGLLEFSKQKLLCGDNIDKLDFCEQCVLSKSKKIKFNTIVHTTKRPFNYVHSDLWGPSRTQPR